MKKQMHNEKGFTLIELVMVIAILGILAATALPLFQNLSDDANVATQKGVIGAVRGGINAKYAAVLADSDQTNDTFMAAVPDLDSSGNALCTGGNPCFSNVLAYSVTDKTWTKVAWNQYVHVATGAVLTYNPVTGIFDYEP